MARDMLVFTAEDGQEIRASMMPQGNIPLSANNGELLKQAALRGLGFVLLPAFEFVKRELQDGTLRQLLPGFRYRR
ncbi:MAG: hypothetical protein R3E89_15190 [Thiolinea sp.]